MLLIRDIMLLIICLLVSELPDRQLLNTTYHYRYSLPVDSFLRKRFYRNSLTREFFMREKAGVEEGDISLASRKSGLAFSREISFL